MFGDYLKKRNVPLWNIIAVATDDALTMIFHFTQGKDSQCMYYSQTPSCGPNFSGELQAHPLGP